MPYRLGFYAFNAVPLLFVAALLSDLILRQRAFPAMFIATPIFIAIMFVLALSTRILTALGKLRLRCPFCRLNGPAWVCDVEGLCMECPSCGSIRAGGKYRWKITRIDHSNQVEEPSPHLSLEEHPAWQRPRSLSVFPDGLKYFRQWRFLRCYLLMLLPLAASASAAWWRHQVTPGISIVIFGTAISSIIFVQLCSGMTSSNWGTYFRSREPARFWVDVLIWSAVYVFLASAGWIVPIAKQ